MIVTPDEREEIEIAVGDAESARLVSDLVAEGFTVDDALELVEFPGWPS